MILTSFHLSFHPLLPFPSRLLRLLQQIRPFIAWSSRRQTVLEPIECDDLNEGTSALQGLSDCIPSSLVSGSSSSATPSSTSFLPSRPRCFPNIFSTRRIISIAGDPRKRRPKGVNLTCQQLTFSRFPFPILSCADQMRHLGVDRRGKDSPIGLDPSLERSMIARFAKVPADGDGQVLERILHPG